MNSLVIVMITLWNPYYCCYYNCVTQVEGNYVTVMPTRTDIVTHGSEYKTQSYLIKILQNSVSAG